MNDISQWYGVLGVKPMASLPTIKAAYRELALLWHPDRYVDDPELKARAEIEIKEINQAYSEIKAFLATRINHTCKPDHHHSNISKTKQTPESYYQQGVIFAEAENYDQALTSFAQAIKLNKDYLEAYQYRGFILSKLGFNLRADAEFKKVQQLKLKLNKVKFNKNSASASHHYQYAQYAKNNYQQATESIAKEPAIKIQTSLPFKYLQTIGIHQQPCKNLVIGQGGVIAGINGSEEIQLWQSNTGRSLGSLVGHKGRVSCLALSPSGQTLITGGKDQTIRFWDLRTKRIRRTFGGGFDSHLSEITTIAISPDNQNLLSCDRDNSLKIWHVNHGKVSKNISFSANVTCLAISPNGQLFCSGGLEPQIRIRQMQDGQVVRSINNNSGVMSLAFSPDGKLLATGGFNRTIKLWDIATGKEIYTLTGHQDRISKIIFSNDGQNIISSSWDKTIKLWKLSTGKEITTVQAHTAQIDSMEIAFNNQTLVSSSCDRTIKLWQLNIPTHF